MLFLRDLIVACLFLTLIGLGRGAIVINEIYYNPEVDNQPIEFIELFNSSDEAVDLSGWHFSDGIDYTFANGVTIAPGAYLVLAENKTIYDTTLGSIFANGVKAAGEFASGRLSNDGELLTLRDASDEVRDEVDYGTRFPWPSAANGAGASMELIHPSLDNDLSGSWRSSQAPTPGRVNSVFSETSPPQIRQVNHSPTSPLPGEVVKVTAKATDPEGVMSMTLRYQIVKPGEYIRLSDEAYEMNWVEIEMNDEGLGGDDQAHDSIYTGMLEESLQKHRHLIRYQIQGGDLAGNSVRVPYADDEQPNFAYFTYGELPAWKGKATETSEPVTYEPEVLKKVPIYHLITTQENHVEAQHLPGTTRGSGYTGSDYLWHGTLVYEGVVYDHIRFRARGGVWRYAMGKNMWKFAFNRGHDFEAKDAHGEPYSTAWRRLNFSAIIQQGDGRHRGEQGLFESVGFDLFRMAGVPSPRTHYVHFRIIKSPTETNVFENQFATDFQGLYLAVEQPDGRLLDSYDLPGGNIYKMEEGTGPSGIGGELNHQGSYPEVNDYSDLRSFKNEGYLSGSRDEQWWKENLHLESYYSYRSIVEAIHHYDIGYGKNYNYYHNPKSGQWSVIPWDLDLTWDDAMFGDGNEPFKSRALSKETFEQEYQNRLRELRDLLYNEEQTGLLIDEKAALVYTPGEPSLIDADRAMWDFNPIMASSYVNSSKSRKGLFYQVVPSRDFEGMMAKMKNYIRTRGQWIDNTLLRGQAIPDTPVVTYTGEEGFPLNGLKFQCGPFKGGSIFAPQEFSAMKWRIAAITDPTAPLIPGERVKYEINSAWESEELTEYNGEISIPAAMVEPSETYRVRVKMKNQQGGWSHWSEPVELTVSEPDISSLEESLIISEILYAPAPATSEEIAAGFTAEDFEFIELFNRSQSPLDLSQVRFTEGIDFDFITLSSATLSGGERGLLVKNHEAFEFRYGNGFLILGEYGEADGGNRLDNAGERLELTYGPGLPLWDFVYLPGEGWPVVAEGQSLVWMEHAEKSSHADPFYWKAGPINGSPGEPSAVIAHDQWKESIFDEAQLANDAISGWTADPDGDGYSNGHEYAFMMDPLTADLLDVKLTFREDADGAFYYMEFPRRGDASDLNYSLEYSEDLELWTSARSDTEPAAAELVESRMEGEANLLRYRLLQPMTHQYWRVRSELKPAE